MPAVHLQHSGWINLLQLWACMDVSDIATTLLPAAHSSRHTSGTFTT